MGILRIYDAEKNLVFEQHNVITQVGYELEAARLAWPGLSGNGGLTSLPQIPGINAIIVGNGATGSAWNPDQSVTGLISPLYIFPLLNVTMAYTPGVSGNVSTVYTGIIGLPVSITGNYTFDEVGLISLFKTSDLNSAGIAASNYTPFNANIITGAGSFPMVSGNYNSYYALYSIVERANSGGGVISVNASAPAYYINWTFQNNFVTGT